MMTELAVHCCK